MIIHVELSPESIQNAIDRLLVRKSHLEEDFEQLIEILANEGAEVAQSSYGSYPATVTPYAYGTHSEITVSGDMPLIAEFGAGTAVVPPGTMFENSPYTPVYEGSYSESDYSESHEFYKYGSWHFGGEYFTEIPARHGLFDAKQYIIENSTSIAREVMTYD